ncbi:DUF3016 domain-containing protein [Uliginosibacterium sp. H3]|uniref:DUF3016 domain-containing protein n=1 Tax=Uliginosibacterium silvisoli TaxID=3114758 RepID=A0ABU6K4M5_9RHOO|nr:DUF3016 domain-containing protein [Uliginosibacterium sp. H3]
MKAGGMGFGQGLAGFGWRRCFLLAALLGGFVGPAMASDLTLEATPELPVKLRFVQIDKFATSRFDREPAGRRDAMLTELGKYAQQAVAPRLPAGQTLQIDVLDLKRAGSSARNARGTPGGAGDIRVIRETDPPRIDLSFRLLDASGGVVRTETRKLRDMNYLSYGDFGDSDPLRYEKRLLDDWVDRDFPKQKRK